MTAKQVFISYKREDRPRVKELAENLRRTGNIVWFDESLQVGDHWWEAILGQIEQCDVFVFAISQRALRSIPCQQERAYATALGKPLLLIKVGSLTAVPTEYSTIQYGDFSKGDPLTLFDLIGGINRIPTGQPNNPNVDRPKPPIAPIEELAAIIDTQAELDFKDQAAILFRLKEAIDGPQARTRALELVELLSRRTEFVKIQEDCRTIIATNKASKRPVGKLLIIAVLLIIVAIAGIGGMVLFNNHGTATSTATSLALNPTPTAITIPPIDIGGAVAGTRQGFVANPTVTSTQSPTIMLTPTVTNTPRPTLPPTATSILANSGIKTSYDLNYANGPSKSFVVEGYGTSGSDLWRTIPLTSHPINPGMGILIEFQIDFHNSTSGDMSFSLNSGDYGTAPYLAWDLVHNDTGWAIVHESGKNNWIPLLHFDFSMQKDNWYYLLWRINSNGKLDTLLWSKDNPSTYILSDFQRSYGTATSVDWRSFIFNLGVNTADVRVARYEELQFPDDYLLPFTPPTAG